MSVARFIADQRTRYQVPLVSVCALLGVSLGWFYKWWGRAQGPAAASGLHTARDRRRDTVDRAVALAFRKARGLHGSPRLLHDLRDDGWTVYVTGHSLGGALATLMSWEIEALRERDLPAVSRVVMYNFGRGQTRLLAQLLSLPYQHCGTLALC